MTPLDVYRELEDQERRMHAVRGALAVLRWDQAVMMPSDSAETRAEQMAGLGVILHDMQTNPARGDLIAEASRDQAVLTDWQQANLREIERNFMRAGALSPELVERKALLASKTEIVWRSARENSEFASVAKSLGDLLMIVREEADRLGDLLSVEPYDALLDKYEPGLKAAEVERLFSALEDDLPDLLDETIERQAARNPALPLEGPFAIADQERLSRKIMVQLGFDFDRGRLDVSHHPFTGGVSGDIRVTTRYEDTDFIQALMATIHETGHALYESGLPHDWRQQPVGASRGMVLHESQSLLFEMQAARSPEYVGYLAGCVREAFGKSGAAWLPDNLLKHYHRVSRGLIRVYADEVSYPLHVILRTRLERQMIAGQLSVTDLPDAWNTEMQSSLGVSPETDAQGCLQDVHWYSGAFGYFPTYTLGALAAAQIFGAASDAVNGLKQDLAKGDVTAMLSWLRRQVHVRASRYSTSGILEKSTGGPLDTAPFLAHLRRRYLS